VERVQTTCTYCGVGCQLILEVKDNKIIKVDSAWDGPSNHGWTCVKGRFGYDFVHHADRLEKPQIRRYLLEGAKKPSASKRQPDKEGNPWQWVEVEWEKALDIVAEGMNQVRNEYGPDSMGFLTSAKCTNEDNYLMNKLARQVIGTNSIDHCARL
jgi:formate dehydrogenase major subunit/formate dehydrogenase alpha subunit